MLTVERSVALPATAAEVWSLIGGFGDLDKWHPAVEGCRTETAGDETVRLLTLPGGGKLSEVLIAHDPARMSYTYGIVEGPLPVRDYRSSLRVDAGTEGCKVVWSGEFEAEGTSDDKAREVIAGIYEAGLDALKKTFAG